MTTFNKKELADKFKTVASVINSSAIIEILKSVKISVDGDKFTMTGANGEIQITTNGECSGSDKFDVCADTKSFALMLQSSKDQIDIKLTGDKLATVSGKSKFNIQTLPSDMYPIIESAGAFNNMPLDLLIGNVYKGAPKKHVQQALMGVLLQSDGSKINAVSTNVQMCMINEIQAESDAFEVIVPNAAAEYFANNKTDGFYIDEGKLVAINNETSTKIVCRLIDGQFPKWQRIIPDNKESFTVNKKELNDSMSIIAKMDQSTGSRWIGENGEMQILSGAKSGSSFSRSIDFSGDDFKINLSPELFSICMTLFDSEDLTIHFNQSNPKQPIKAICDNKMFVIAPLLI